MKKTQRIDLFVNIKKTIVSFISIVLFVTCGMGVLLGLDWSEMSLKSTLNRQFELGNFHDIEVFFPYGYSEEDINIIKNTEGVDEVEEQYYAYEFFYWGNKRLQSKIVSITYNVDRLVDLDGRLPRYNNEVVIDENAASKYGIKLGDKIHLENENAYDSYLYNQVINGVEDTSALLDDSKTKEISYLKEDELTVVGIATSSEYFSRSNASYGVSLNNAAQINIILYVNYSQFNPDVVTGYNSILIRSNALSNLDSFSTKYKDGAKALADTLDSSITTISKTSYERLVANTGTLLEEFEERLHESKQRIDEGFETLLESEIKLNEAKLQIEQYKSELVKAKDELSLYKTELSNAKLLLDAAKNELDEGKKEYNSKFSEYEEYKDQYDLIKNNYDIAYNAQTTALSYLEDSMDYSYFEFVVFANEGMQEIMDTLFSDDALAVLYGFIDQVDEAKAIEITSRINQYRAEYGSYNGLVFITHPLTTVFDFYQELIDFEEEILALSKTYYAQFVPLAEDELSNAKAKLDDAKKQIEDGEKEYNSKLAEYNLGISEYKDNEALINSKENELKAYENELKSEYSSLLESQDILTKAKEEYNDAQLSFQKLRNASAKTENYGTISFTRTENAIFIYNTLESDAISRVKGILGGLFLALSVFVSYSVISRLVNDQKKQIGVKKAFGFTQLEIGKLYTAYVGLAFAFGCILSIGLAFAIEYYLVPLLTQNVYSYKVVGDYFSVKNLILIGSLEFAFMELVAILACSVALKKSSIELLYGTNFTSHKKRFYENTRAFKRLPTIKQTIINNMVNDPRRVFASLIGIAGAAALIVSSVSMRNDVLNSYDRQYKDYFHFDVIVEFDSQIEGAQEGIEKILLNNSLDSCPIYYTKGYSSCDGSKKLLTDLFVFDNSEVFSKFVNFELTDSTEYEYKGAVFPEAIQSYYSLDNNEPMVYETFTGDKASMNSKGFYKLYSYSLTCFMDMNSYEEEFGKSVRNNSLLVYAGNSDLDELREELASVPGFTQIYEYYLDDYLDCAVFKTIATAVVSVYLLVAILMSIFVLLNLLITYVMEKKKELTILLINGYSLKDAQRYIYVDTLLLTIAGCILGVGIGVYTGKLAVDAFSSEYVKLDNSLNIVAILLGVGITAILSYVMTRIAIKKIERFELIDIEN